MKISPVVWRGVSFAALFCVVQASGQTLGNWSTARNDAGHAGVQKAEKIITKDNLSSEFKFLWKIKLGTAAGDSRSYSEPLLIPRLINAHGFKDFVIWAGQQDVYAVDSELGTMLWQKHYDAAPAASCGISNMAMLMEPPAVINFGARRAPGTPPPQPQPPLAVSARRVGVSAGGGGFGLKGIYVLTADGYLHEQVVATGADFAPPVKFLPGPGGVSKGISIEGKTLYSVTSSGCGAENALYAIDVNSPSYPVYRYSTNAVPQLVAMGPTLGDGVAYVVTGKGSTNASAGIYSNSIVALTPDAKVKDWFTPAGKGELHNVTPVAFTYKQKKLLVAPGKDGSFVLLDAESLGGTDHQTPLAQSTSVSKVNEDTPSALAVWQDAAGAAWVFASIPGQVDAAKFGMTNGLVSHGSIVAFKIEDEGGKWLLAPQWISHDFVNPAPPVIANGMVVVLAQGNASTHAKLVLLDAGNGKELYSSGDSIGTYAHMAGVAVGDGHVFFVTHDNTLYSFGIGLEH